jgi:hypothetical protein
MTTQKDLTFGTLDGVTAVPVDNAWRPTHRVMPIRVVPTVGGGSANSAPLNPANVVVGAATGVPKPLLALAAVQTPVKQQSYTNCNLTVSFTQDSTDKNFNHVNIWLQGYRGNPNPVLVAAGASSPINFICDASQETVTVIGQTVSSAGVSADVSTGITTTVKLSGIVAAPPAPTLSSNAVGTATGFQFAFNQVVLPAGDAEVIAAYNVYRATSNSFGASSLIQTISPNPGLTGAITFTDTIVAAVGFSYYYWVTAVNTAGFESTATAAQSSAAIGSIGSTPYSSTNGFTYTATTTSITWTWSGIVINRADNTNTNVPNGSQLITGLTPNTTYYFYPFWDEATQTLLWNSNGTGSPTYAYTATSLAVSAQINLRNRIPLTIGGMAATTPNSGSGGGSGGGGGGGGCFSDSVRIRTAAGFKRFDEIGDVVEIINETGTHTADHIIHENWKGDVLDIGCGYVTTNHLMQNAGAWIPAITFYQGKPVFGFKGRVHNLHVRTLNEKDKHYILENGDVAHNLKPQ